MNSQGRLDHWKETMTEHMNEIHRRFRYGALTLPTLSTYAYGRNDLKVPMSMATAVFNMISQANSAV